MIVLALVGAAGVLAGLVVWLADLPLRPAYWTKKQQRKAAERGESYWEKRLAETDRGKLGDEMFLAKITPEQLFRRRIAYMATGWAVLGLLSLVLLPLIAVGFVLAAAAVGGWFLPVFQIRSAAENFRFELEQTLPQLLTLTAMAMTSLSLSDAVHYASAASDHRTFQLYQQLIPPPNSTKSFGDALFDFGKRYGLPELANRGTILRTAAKEGGRNVRETVQRQAEDCRKFSYTKLEEQLASRAAVSGSAPLAILLGLFVFILWPVSQQLGTSTDPSVIVSEAAEVSE